VEQALHGRSDLDFLKRVFGKLSANYGWWVNRKDRTGNNLYEGGFLGLDNIGVFARSAPLPTGGHLEQADATAWIALFCENMLEIACEIAPHDPVYEDLAANFAIQFLLIARSLNALGAEGMWDEEDGFYYDVLRLPNGTSARLKVRSMVGLLPICATTIIEPVQREKMPKLKAHFADRVRQIPELFKSIPSDRTAPFRRRGTRIAREIANRLSRIFLRDAAGRRRCSAASRNFSAIHTGAITSCFTNISTATMAAASAPAIRQAGPASSAA
jgi:hypothetical protein